MGGEDGSYLKLGASWGSKLSGLLFTCIARRGEHAYPPCSGVLLAMHSEFGIHSTKGVPRVENRAGRHLTGLLTGGALVSSCPGHASAPAPRVRISRKQSCRTIGAGPRRSFYMYAKELCLSQLGCIADEGYYWEHRRTTSENKLCPDTIRVFFQLCRPSTL